MSSLIHVAELNADNLVAGRASSKRPMHKIGLARRILDIPGEYCIDTNSVGG